MEGVMANFARVRCGGPRRDYSVFCLNLAYLETNTFITN